MPFLRGIARKPSLPSGRPGADPGSTCGVIPPMRSRLRIVAAVIAVTAVLGVTAGSAGADGATDRWPTYGPTFTLNPSGGVTGSDGMRITFGGSQLQVQRREDPNRPGEVNGEVYSPWAAPGTKSANDMFNHIALAVGDVASGGTAFVAPSFCEPDYDYCRVASADNVDVKQWTVASSASPTQIVTILTGEVDGLTYTVAVTLSYTSPEDRMKFEYSVIVPAGNTKPVRLYHLIDSFLGGSDQGPGFYKDPQACGASGLSGAVVGVDRADLGVVEAFQYVSGTPWTSYASANYSDVVFGNNNYTDPDNYEEGPHLGPGFMNDFSEQIITDPEMDNGFGVGWNFGSDPGGYSAVNKLIFSADAVDPCEDLEAVSPTNPDPTVLPDPVIEPDVEVFFDPEKDEVPEIPSIGPKYTG